MCFREKKKVFQSQISLENIMTAGILRYFKMLMYNINHKNIIHSAAQTYLKPFFGLLSLKINILLFLEIAHSRYSRIDP